jgi:phage terminase small subunit
MSLTEKQTKFIQEYLLSGNATDAARKAGYSEKTANEQGARLLANVSVSAEIKKAQQLRKDKFELDEQKIINSLMDIAFADPMDFVELKKGSFVFKKSIAKAIMRGSNFNIYPEYQTKEDKKQGIVRAKLALSSGDRKGALELLGQHIGMWGNKNVPDGAGDSGNNETALQRIQRIVRERSDRLGQKKSDNGEGSK